MLKPRSSFYEPDVRFEHLSFHDEGAGLVRPINVDDLYAEVVSIKITPSVPAEIRNQFDIARNAYLYSWLVYDFVILAEEHCYVVLEMALKHRAKLEGGTGTPTLKPLLQRAVRQGWLTAEDLDIPGPTPMSFLNEMPRLRDRLLHGNIHWSPDFTLLIMRKCATLLNNLYPD
jgi:hypothetical protein